VAVADLLARLLQEGTAAMTATQLAERVARMGGSLYVGAGFDQTTLSASCLSEYAPELAQLMADIVLHPALPASQLPRLKTDLKRQMALARAQPGTQARQKFAAAVYGATPTAGRYPLMPRLMR
jgi:predicted Zn-dependent peptidase